MSHLALDPQQLASIDFETFPFPKVHLVERESAEDLLMLVWAEGRTQLLLDREVPREDAERIREVRDEVDQFNADPVSGWRELIITAHEAEMTAIATERDALAARRRTAAAHYDDAGFALMRARRGASSRLSTSVR